MKTYQPNITNRAVSIRAKLLYGMRFGAALGLAFAIFAWGFDAYLLSTMNSFYPWVKFIIGLIPCVLVGSITGWLSARIDKTLVATLLWALTAFFFAWLLVAVPLRMTPSLLTTLDPSIKGLLHYTYYEGLLTRTNVIFVWVAIFVSLAGLLQIPLSDAAIFSTSVFGRNAPLLVSFVLMGICGMFIDGLSNELLRSPIYSLNKTIQFAIDHQGQKVEPAESRSMHLTSLRMVTDVISPERKLIVSGYNEDFGEVSVLVRFQETWVECKVLYNQPLSCELVKGASQ